MTGIYRRILSQNKTSTTLDKCSQMSVTFLKKSVKNIKTNEQTKSRGTRTVDQADTLTQFYYLNKRLTLVWQLRGMSLVWINFIKCQTTTVTLWTIKTELFWKNHWCFTGTTWKYCLNCQHTVLVTLRELNEGNLCFYVTAHSRSSEIIPTHTINNDRQ